MNFAERLSDARKNAHRNPGSAGRTSDVSRQTVSKWESRGQAQPEAGQDCGFGRCPRCDLWTRCLRDETLYTVQVQMTGNNSFTIDRASLYPILTRY